MKSPAFADVELRISKQEPLGYRVALTVNWQQEFAGVIADPGTLRLDPDRPDELPVQLFRALFADPSLAGAWQKVQGAYPQRRIRVRIDEDVPELHALPWELMREPQAPVACDLAASVQTPMSRYVAGGWKPGAPIVTRPVRILVAIADPAELASDRFGAPIDRAAELVRLRAATEKLGLPVEVTVLDEPCTLAGLTAKLQGEKAPHIIHFVGHGAVSGQGRAALLLADEADRTKVRIVDETQFAAMFAQVMPQSHDAAQSPLRLVVLLSCDSGNRNPGTATVGKVGAHDGEAFRGIAPQLVLAGVPAVVAMQDVVAVAAAHEFLSAFYPSLFEHGLVDLAVNQARLSLREKRLPCGAGKLLPSYAIPILYMRLPQGQLLGTRGIVAARDAESYWTFILDAMETQRCLPILGPRLGAGLLPSPEEIADILVEKLGYPLDDKWDLVRVAQFIYENSRGALGWRYRDILASCIGTTVGRRSEDPALRSQPLDELMARIAERNGQKLSWAQAIRERHETTVYHQLASLNLPLYLTTTHDPLLESALRSQGKNVRAIEPRWVAREGQPQWPIDSPRPSPSDPVVFHLNGIAGTDAQLRNIVLTEDQFFQHLVRLARDKEWALPTDVLGAVGSHALLFIGFHSTDWSFRVLLQGLLPAFEPSGKRMVVGVQLDIADQERRKKAYDYLEDYLLKEHETEVYWGTPEEFVSDLLSRWRQ